MIQLDTAKAQERRLRNLDATRTLTDEETLEWEQLKDDIEYFEEFIA